MNTTHLAPLILRQCAIGYSRQPAVLQNVDHVFEGPGIHLVIGRNGSGKSTLLRTVSGLQKPLSGEVEFERENVHAMSSSRRAKCLAYVASTPPRNSELRVGQVLELVSSEDDANRTALEKHGHMDWWDRPLHTLSDGEAQRVMFARAQLQGANWIVLDEPTAFLDVPSRQAFWEQLNSVREQEMGILVATHDYSQFGNNRPLASVVCIAQGGLKAIDVSESPENWTRELM